MDADRAESVRMKIELPDLPLNLAAAHAVMRCDGAGIRAYARAGGLDPAKDFRGRNLSGFPLAGQNLAGFDFSGCDLRGTQIEHAIVDESFLWKDALLDEGVVPGSQPERDIFAGVTLELIHGWAARLNEDGEDVALAALGSTLLPLIEARVAPSDKDSSRMLQIEALVCLGEVHSGALARGMARAEKLLANPAEARAPNWVRHFADSARAEGLQKLGRFNEALIATDAQLADDKKIFGERAEYTLSTRHVRASVLRDLGRYDEALAEIKSLLKVEMEVRGPRDEATLNTRYLRAGVLRDLGRYNEALIEVDSLLPLYVETRGPRDQDTLNTRHLRASVLQDLGRYNEALTEVESVLPLRVELIGPCHRNTLTTRYLRASVLQDLGRHGEALAEVESLLPLYVETRGPRDRDTLTTRYLRAWILHSVGRSLEALEALEELVAVGTEALGPSDWHIAAYRSLMLGVRMASAADFVPEAELLELVASLSREPGQFHKVTLRARYRLAHALLAAGRRDEARTTIRVTIAGYDPATDLREVYLAASRRLLDVIDGREPGADLPA